MLSEQGMTRLSQRIRNLVAAKGHATFTARELGRMLAAPAEEVFLVLHLLSESNIVKRTEETNHALLDTWATTWYLAERTDVVPLTVKI